jgi:hypothetical protein
MAVSVNNPSTGGVVVAPHGGVDAQNPTTGGSAQTSNAGVSIPTGVPGPPGKSAYELALENGFVGTEEEWLAEVEGDVGPVGPQGPQGPQGQPGAGSYYEEFGFASPLTTWTIVHNRNSLGVNVETVDVNGDPVEGFVRALDANVIEVDWYYPTAGTARVWQ